MDILQSNDIVFSVFGGEYDKDGNFVPKGMYGTAFYIKNNNFLTCGHTVNNVKQHPLVAIGFQNKKNILNYMSVVDYEVFTHNDSGILVSNVERAQPLKWLKQELIMLNDVVSTGFPFGFDAKNRKLLQRSFKGYISLVGTTNTLPNQPFHYELSYMCPKGISGAPLLCKYGNELVICGMTIGNEITSNVAFSYSETLTENNETIKHEVHEAFHRGIAVQTRSFFDIKSRILGGTFIEYLNKEGLIIDR